MMIEQPENWVRLNAIVNAEQALAALGTTEGALKLLLKIRDDLRSLDQMNSNDLSVYAVLEKLRLAKRTGLAIELTAKGIALYDCVVFWID